MKSISTDNKSAIQFIPTNPINKNVLELFMDEESADIVFEVGGEQQTKGKRKKVKIELFKSKDKKYYININPSIPKNGFGLLTKVIRRKPVYEKYVMKTKQFKKLENPVHGISVGISKKGVHHGNRGSFQDYFYFDFNNKNDADKLFKFVSKYTKSVDKNRTKRTKRKL